MSETVAVLSPNPQFQILDPDNTTSAVNVYFANPTVTLVGPASGLPLWQTAYGGQDSTLTSTNYDGAPALEWQVSSALGHSDWIYTYAPFVPGNTYQISADVAGSGTVAINAWDGNENVSGPPITLTSNFQTISETVLALAPNTVVVAPSTPQFQLVDPDNAGSSALTLYFKNVTWKQVVPAPQPPTGVSAQLLRGDRVKVDWSAPAQCSGSGLPTITGYDVYVTTQPFAENYSSPSATVSGCGSGAATNATVQVPGGGGGDRVVYATVVVMSAEGNSTPSPQVSTVQLTGYDGEAQSAVQELQTYYDSSTGLFNTAAAGSYGRPRTPIKTRLRTNFSWSCPRGCTHQASHLQWAQKELTWFNGSGLINSSSLINDGLTTSCQNNGQTTWTYNEGVILAG